MLTSEHRCLDDETSPDRQLAALPVPRPEVDAVRPSVARAELLTTVRELGSSVAALDPRTGEDDPPRLVAIADDLQLLLEQAIDTLGVLRDLEDEPSAPELVLDFGEGDSDVEEGSSHRAPVLSPPRLANICFCLLYTSRCV